MKLKFYLLTLISVCTLVSPLLAQDHPLEYTSSESIHIDPKDCKIQMLDDYFEEGEYLYMITSKVKYHARLYFPFMLSFTPETEKLYVLKYNKIQKKLIQPERVDVELPHKTFEVLATNFFHDTLNILGVYGMKKKNKYFFYCIQYDLKTKKSYTKKVFEFSSKTTTSVNKSVLGGFSIVAQDPKIKQLAIKYVLIDKHLNVSPESKLIKSSLIKRGEIKSYFTSYNNNLYIKVIKKGSDQKFYNSLFTVDNNKLKNVTIDDKKNFYSSMYFYIDDDTKEIKIISFYGKTKNNTEGVFLASLDEKQNKIINNEYCPYKNLNFDDHVETEEKDNTKKGKSKSSKKMERKKRHENVNDKRDQKMLKSSAMNITWIQKAKDGTTYVLAEFKALHIRSSTTRNSGLSFNRNSMYYQYGPGVLYVFDKDNKFKLATKYKYAINRSYSYDIGVGLELSALSDNRVICKIGIDNYLLKPAYERSNELMEIARKRGIVKNLKGAFISKMMINTKNAVYILDKDKEYNYYIKENVFE